MTTQRLSHSAGIVRTRKDGRRVSNTAVLMWLLLAANAPHYALSFQPRCEYHSFGALCPSTGTFSPRSVRRTKPTRPNRIERLDSVDVKGRDGSALYSVSDVLVSISTTASSFDDMMYQVESAASSLAAISLQDPSNLATAIPILYLAGLLTSFSPCVWGLLPLTVSYISTAAGERKDKQTIWPTVAFAAGLAMVFCSLGVAAVEFGQVFGATTGVGGLMLPLLSNGICLVMGFKLLDMIDLPLPSLDFINPQKQMQKAAVAGTGGESLILIDATGQILSSSSVDSKSVASETNEGSALARTFLLGGSSALVASPCATPVLTSILAFVATASNPLLGASLLLCYTLGYATPLLLVAGTGGQALVQLRQLSSDDSHWYARLAPWVTPVTGGILLYLGTTGMLTALFGDPSLAGLTILE